MIRLSLIAAVFMAGSLAAPCQNTFIVHFDSVQNGLGGVGRSIFEVDQGYLLFVESLVADGMFEGRCGTYRLNANGGFISHQIYEPLQQYSCDFGIFDPVDRRGTDGFAAAVSRFNFDPWVREVSIYQFNEDGDSIASELLLSYPIDDSVRLGIQHARLTSDGGMILGGFHEITTLAKGLLIRVDSILNVQWIKTFGLDSHENLVLGVAEYLNNGSLAIGHRSMSYVSNDCFLRRSDSLGNQIWRREFGEDAVTFGSVRVLPDSTIVTWSEYREDNWELNYQQLMLTKWDQDGEVIWQRRSHYQSNARSGDIEVLPDGSFIAVGVQGAWGALMKFSAEGDSVWTRYLHVFGPGSIHFPNDVEPTSDGGFISTGDAYQGDPPDPHPNAQTTWVIKTDSLGCVVPGCQNVGVQEYMLDLQEHLSISPNPATNTTTIRLPLPTGAATEGQVRVLLLDATGRLVMEQAADHAFAEVRCELDVSGLPAGVYYAHLRDARRWLAGGKVVVE